MLGNIPARHTMINLQTQLFGNNIYHRTLKIIQKHLPNSKLSKTVWPGFMTRQTHTVLISKKNTNFKFLILFYRRFAYYFYILNIRDTHRLSIGKMNQQGLQNNSFRLEMKPWIHADLCIFKIFFYWDSLCARLSSHYKAWSYKKKKHRKIKAYRKFV